MLTLGMVSDDLTDFFYASQIATAIKDAVTVELVEPAAAARRRLEEARFDQAPVMEWDRPVGWVATASLTARQTVKSVMTPLDSCAMVSAESSIASILQILPRNKLVFIVSKRGLSGFIVQSDLDRHAVRSYFYLLISGIEMLLSEVVKSVIPEEQAAMAIRADMRKGFDRARIVNKETSAAEYLYINELIGLFDQTPYACDPNFWNESLTNLMLKVKAFRNTVMHPTRSIAATDDIEATANLAGWAGEVAGALRGIVASLEVRTRPTG